MYTQLWGQTSFEVSAIHTFQNTKALRHLSISKTRKAQIERGVRKPKRQRIQKAAYDSKNKRKRLDTTRSTQKVHTTHKRANSCDVIWHTGWTHTTQQPKVSGAETCWTFYVRSLNQLMTAMCPLSLSVRNFRISRDLSEGRSSLFARLWSIKPIFMSQPSQHFHGQPLTFPDIFV